MPEQARTGRELIDATRPHTAKLVGSNIGSYAMMSLDQWAQASTAERLRSISRTRKGTSEPWDCASDRKNKPGCPRKGTCEPFDCTSDRLCAPGCPPKCMFGCTADRQCLAGCPRREDPVYDSLCDKQCFPGPALPEKNGWAFPRPGPVDGVLKYVDQWHGQCEQKRGYREEGTGFCKKDTVCWPGDSKFPEGGVWKCRRR